MGRQRRANAGHLTLPNGTGTDLFCSSQVLLPPASPTSSAGVFVAGGDVWNTSTNSTSNTGNTTASSSMAATTRWRVATT